MKILLKLVLPENYLGWICQIFRRKLAMHLVQSNPYHHGPHLILLYQIENMK